MNNVQKKEHCAYRVIQKSKIPSFVTYEMSINFENSFADKLSSKRAIKFPSHQMLGYITL